MIESILKFQFKTKFSAKEPVLKRRSAKTLLLKEKSDPFTSNPNNLILIPKFNSNPVIQCFPT